MYESGAGRVHMWATFSLGISSKTWKHYVKLGIKHSASKKNLQYAIFTPALPLQRKLHRRCVGPFASEKAMRNVNVLDSCHYISSCIYFKLEWDPSSYSELFKCLVRKGTEFSFHFNHVIKRAWRTVISKQLYNTCLFWWQVPGIIWLVTTNRTGTKVRMRVNIII